MSGDDPTSVDLVVDGHTVRTTPGTSVAAAIMNSGVVQFRRAVTGAWRGPVCGMGICHECRVTINGVPHRRACMVTAVSGMAVSIQEGDSR